MRAVVGGQVVVLGDCWGSAHRAGGGAKGLVTGRARAALFIFDSRRGGLAAWRGGCTGASLLAGRPLPRPLQTACPTGQATGPGATGAMGAMGAMAAAQRQ